MKPKCLVIGDLNIDIIVGNLRGFPELGKEIFAKDFFIGIGGSGGIFTAVLSQLGIKTSIISKIGNDFLGNFLIKEMKKYKADTKNIIVENGQETGITITLSYEKDKSQISKLNLIKSLKINEIQFDNLENLSHVHFAGYYSMDNLKKSYIDIIKIIKDKFNGVTFSLDTNYDSEDRWGNEIYDLFKHIDILFLNKKEALKISKENSVKDAAEKLSVYTDIVIIKMGKEGFFAKIGNKYFEENCLNTLNKNFKDGTGSGDNFDAGFIYGFMNNLGTSQSLKFANFCGEKSIEFLGGPGSEKKFLHLKNHIKSI